MDLHEVTSYRRATSRADLALAPGEVVVAGGTWLFSEPQPGTAGLVDLTTLGWPAYERTDAGLSVSATCTIEQLANVPESLLGDAATLVRSCADALLMSFKIQRFATVGGNVCLALPAGAMTSLLAGLGATALVWKPDGGERRVLVADLVTGVRRSGLAPGEVLRALEIPAASLTARTAFRQISLAPTGRSSAVVVGRYDDDDGCTLTVTAATTRPVVLRFASLPSYAALTEALTDVTEWYADAHGPVDWRRHVTGLLSTQVRDELAA